MLTETQVIRISDLKKMINCGTSKARSLAKEIKMDAKEHQPNYIDPGRSLIWKRDVVNFFEKKFGIEIEADSNDIEKDSKEI